jgi:glycosyltransferase involved in cell wall biosynthesis
MLLDIIRTEKPDLVEVCDKYSLPYLAGLIRTGALSGLGCRPVTVGLSCERMDYNVASYLTAGGFGGRFSRLYMKWIYFPMFDHHIAVSDHVAEELRIAARGHKVPRATWIRPHGVDADLFSPARRSKEFRRTLFDRSGANPRAALLLYAGRLAPEKNLSLLLDTLVELMRNGGEFHLLIAGDGISRGPLERAAASAAPGRVTFLGHIGDRMELARLYANCDAFLHPNPSEPFGIAPLEAMASGIPLVAPDSGGLVTYASSHNAWLSAPAASEFAGAVRNILRDPYQRILRTHAALATAARYDWRNIASSYLQLYAEIYAIGRGLTSHHAVAPSFLSTPGNWLGMEIS